MGKKQSRFKTIKAQSILEYAVIIAVVVAALLAMQIYVKRSFQGRFRQAADSIGEQYAPKNTDSLITDTFKSYSKTTVTTEEKDGKISSTTETVMPADNPGEEPRNVQTRTGYEKVGSLESSLY